MQTYFAKHLFLIMFGFAIEIMEILQDGCCVVSTGKSVADALVSRVLPWISVALLQSIIVHCVVLGVGRPVVFVLPDGGLSCLGWLWIGKFLVGSNQLSLAGL